MVLQTISKLHYKIKQSCAVVCWIGPVGRCLETCLQTGPETPLEQKGLFLVDKVVH